MPIAYITVYKSTWPPPLMLNLSNEYVTKSSDVQKYSKGIKKGKGVDLIAQCFIDLSYVNTSQNLLPVISVCAK